jgi:hypothetical protein
LSSVNKDCGRMACSSKLQAAASVVEAHGCYGEEKV